MALYSTGQKVLLRNPQLLKLSSRVRRTFPRSSRPLLVGVSCIDPHALHGCFAFELPPPTFVCPHQFDELVPVAIISCLFILPNDLFRVGHLAEPGLPYTPLVSDFVPARHAFSYHEREPIFNKGRTAARMSAGARYCYSPLALGFAFQKCSV